MAAAGLGTTVFASGPLAASCSLAAFFCTSAALTAPPPTSAGAARSAGQVIANGAALAAGVITWQRNRNSRALAFAGGAVAAATADTWATELGVRFGGTPRLPTSLRAASPGTNGAVSVVGLLASCGGAAAVSLVFAGNLGLAGSRRLLRACIVGGVSGALIDSLLGGTLEPRLPLPSDAARNNAVNLLATATGGVAAALITGSGPSRSRERGQRPAGMCCPT